MCARVAPVWLFRFSGSGGGDRAPWPKPILSDRKSFDRIAILGKKTVSGGKLAGQEGFILFAGACLACNEKRALTSGVDFDGPGLGRVPAGPQGEASPVEIEALWRIWREELIAEA